MSNIDLADRRRQMGQALIGWSGVPGAVHAVRDGSWMYRSGLPSPDLNMALVHGSDPGDLTDVVGHVDELGAPTLLFCTGDGLALAEQLGNGWAHVGAMSFMIADVARTPQGRDARVRRATHEDREAVLGLWTDAFGIPAELFGQLLDAQLSGRDADMGPGSSKTTGSRSRPSLQVVRETRSRSGAWPRRRGSAVVASGEHYLPTRWLAQRLTASRSGCWERHQRASPCMTQQAGQLLKRGRSTPTGPRPSSTDSHWHGAQQ